MALPVLRPARPGARRCRRRRPRRLRLGPDRRAEPLGPSGSRRLGQTCLHQRQLPLPRGAPARPRRQPHRRLPRRVRPARRLRGPGVPALRRRGVPGHRVPQRLPGGRGAGEPAGPGARRHRRGQARAQRAPRARPPVVGGQLRGGPGPVVAARHLPAGDRPCPPRCRDRRRLAARGLRSRDRRGHPDARGARRRRGVPGHDQSSTSWAWPTPSRPQETLRRSRWASSSRGARTGPASTTPG